MIYLVRLTTLMVVKDTETPIVWVNEGLMVEPPRYAKKFRMYGFPKPDKPAQLEYQTTEVREVVPGETQTAFRSQRGMYHSLEVLKEWTIDQTLDTKKLRRLDIRVNHQKARKLHHRG